MEMIRDDAKLMLSTYTPHLGIGWLNSAARRVQPHSRELAGLLNRICTNEQRRRESEQTDSPLDVDPPDVTEIVTWTDAQLASALPRSAFLLRICEHPETLAFLSDLHDILCAITARRLQKTRH